jgi:hypothetical protein
MKYANPTARRAAGIVKFRASRFLASGIVAVGLLLCGNAQAHHSFAGFDQTKKVTIKGTVKEWQFTNPHSWLQVLVEEGGQQVEYSIETASVSTLVRRGWTRTTFTPGEKLTLVVYPLSTGGRGGALVSATFDDGKTVTSGIPAN